MTDELCRLSVGELRRLYRERKLSPVEVTDAFLSRIDRLNGTFNAYVLVTADKARVDARDAERRFSTASDPGELPPLLGVPFSVKDTLPTAGVRTTFGSPLFHDNIPTEDAAAVTILKRGGGILLGKTNSPTLGWIPVTQNKLFGPTPNPWKPELTAGGSSGGAAVAAATALAPVNIGTDGGGSLRIPASFTGIVGFKPSYGRVANYPTGPNWGLQHVGPLARTVEDVAITLDVMAGPDCRDPYSLPKSGIKFEKVLQQPAEPMKILFCSDLGYSEAIDPVVLAICREAVGAFSELGHQVTERKLDWPSPMPIWQTMFVMGVANRLAEFAADRPDDIEAKLHEFIAEGQRMEPGAYHQAWLAKNDWWQHVWPVFEIYDLVVTPTVACLPFPVGQETVGKIAGIPVSFYGWTPFSAPFNLTGQPAISLPAGRSKQGLPVGLQIVGRRFDDDMVLNVAAAYEKLRPWPISPPSDQIVRSKLADYEL